MDPTLIANEISEKIFDKIFDFNIWALLIKFIFIYVVLFFIKYIGESTVGYLKFRMNQNVIQGSRIIYNGEKGVIKKIGFFTIIIETKNGWMPIPTREWGNSKMIKLKNKTFKCRRKDDIILNKETIKNENE